MTNALQRIRELAVQSANGTYTSNDRANLDAEAQQLIAEITRITDETLFNGATIFNGSDRSFQIGADAGRIIQIAAAGAFTTVAAPAGDVASQGAASALIVSIDSLLDNVASRRAVLGAAQSRFNSVIASLQNSTEALTASRSRIEDADFAAETARLARSQILQQASTAMLAQANLAPQLVLRLLE